MDEATSGDRDHVQTTSVIRNCRPCGTRTVRRDRFLLRPMGDFGRMGGRAFAVVPGNAAVDVDAVGYRGSLKRVTACCGGKTSGSGDRLALSVGAVAENLTSVFRVKGTHSYGYTAPALRMLRRGNSSGRIPKTCRA